MFSTFYQNTTKALRAFQLRREHASLGEISEISIPPVLLESVQFNLQELVHQHSEYIICETLIFPILYEAWRPFSEDLMLWSHQTITTDKGLSGSPDYLITKRLELNRVVQGSPFLVVVEVKQDDFIGAWGQCLAELYVMQQVNKNPDLLLFGIVTNGKAWEFGSLQHDCFVKYTNICTVHHILSLYSTLTHLLGICQQQVRLL